MSKYTVAERMKKLELIAAEVAKGAVIDDAIKTVGISKARFYKWRHASTRKAHRTRVVAKPAAIRASKAQLSRHVVESILTDPHLNSAQIVRMLTAYVQG